jgi:hypothetical protein
VPDRATSTDDAADRATSPAGRSGGTMRAGSHKRCVLLDCWSSKTIRVFLSFRCCAHQGRCVVDHRLLSCKIDPLPPTTTTTTRQPVRHAVQEAPCVLDLTSAATQHITLVCVSVVVCRAAFVLPGRSHDRSTSDAGPCAASTLWICSAFSIGGHLRTSHVLLEVLLTSAVARR